MRTKKNKITFPLTAFILACLILVIIGIKDYEKGNLYKSDTTQDKLSLNFPEDEYPHKNALSEWWYFNSHLTDENGKNYGIMNLVHNTGLSMILVVDKDGQKYHSFEDKSDFNPISTQFIDWSILENG